MTLTRLVAVLAVVAAACGSSGGAPSPDGGADASAGTVTVTTLATSLVRTPVVGATVVFDDVDGTVTEVVTDASGQARAHVARGASVTAIYTVSPQARVIETVLDVAPGEAIEIAPILDPARDIATADVAVQVPADASATDAWLYGPCGSIHAPLSAKTTLPLYPGCTDDPMTLLAVAQDAQGAPVGYVADVVPFAPHGSASLPATWQPFATMTTTVTGVTAGASVVQTWVFSPDWFGLVTTAYATQPTTSTVPLAVPTPLLAGTRMIKSSDGRQQYQQIVPGDTTTYALDVGAVALPRPARPTLLADSHQLQVAFTGGNAGDVDAFNAGVVFERTGAADATLDVQWEVWGGTPGTVTLPALPADLQYLLPLASDKVVNTLANTFHLDGGGYDALRPHLFTRLGDPLYGRGPAMAAPLVNATTGYI